LLLASIHRCTTSETPELLQSALLPGDHLTRGYVQRIHLGFWAWKMILTESVSKLLSVTKRRKITLLEGCLESQMVYAIALLLFCLS
jgi:hypothetical protein